MTWWKLFLNYLWRKDNLLVGQNICLIMIQSCKDTGGVIILEDAPYLMKTCQGIMIGNMDRAGGSQGAWTRKALGPHNRPPPHNHWLESEVSSYGCIRPLTHLPP